MSLSQTGACWIISNERLAYAMAQKSTGKTANIDVWDEEITGYRGPLTSQLAPPHYHFDNIDIDGDGKDDLIVAADNLGIPSPNAGAVIIKLSSDGPVN